MRTVTRLQSSTRLRIGIVEDDEDISLYLKEFLAREGHGVATLGRSPDALQEIGQGNYQLVLLDVGMPVADSEALLRGIRSRHPEICVILMTAYPWVEGAAETLESEAFDTLRKPFGADQLREVIQRAIREMAVAVDTEEHIVRLLGARIRSLRKDRALTLKQLSSRTLLSVSLLSQIERGKTAASVSTLHKVTTALDVTLSHLLDGI